MYIEMKRYSFCFNKMRCLNEISRKIVDPLDLVTKQYVDNSVSSKANNDNVVHLTDNETIAGIKTFDDNTFFNGTATWRNCDDKFTSQYMYGMYQWDNMFQFTKRTTNNTYINEAWHIQLDTEQLVFNYPTSFASRPTVGGSSVALKSDTGELTNLNTTAKNNLVASINELFTSVSNGKATVASAITDKGVTTSSDATFATMASNIRAIPSGIVPSGNKEITQQTGTDVTNFATASVRSGSVSLNTPSINSSGLITASATLGTSGWIGSAPSSKTLQLTTKAATTITPSTYTQTAVDSGVYTTGAISVAAIQTETKTATANGDVTPTSGKYLTKVTVAIPVYDGTVVDG